MIYLLILLSGASFPPSGDVWKPVSGSWNTPVLQADNATWEHSAVQEPQVIYIPETQKMRMWYRGAGWGFPSSVGVADSLDGGKTWIKYKHNPVYIGADHVSTDCAGQPWIYKEANEVGSSGGGGEGGGKYWLFTTNNHPARTCVATSDDGLNWTNASKTAASVVPLPPNGKLFGNRAVWKEPDGTWRLLQELMAGGIWEVYLYKGTSPLHWTLDNGRQPLRQLQRHPGSMYGGIHIATVDGVFQPKSPDDGLYHVWYHAGAKGNLPTDIYHATSSDLSNWTVTPSTPVISHVGKGSFSFDQVADPSPLTVGAVAYMAYDGDNNGCRDCSHAAIGLATAPAGSRKSGKFDMTAVLISNLAHELAPVRLRALKSLIFKLEHGLLRIADLAEEADLLCNLLEWFNRPTQLECEMYDEVCTLLAQFAEHPVAATILVEI
eukprot:gene13454-18396_t